MVLSSISGEYDHAIWYDGSTGRWHHWCKDKEDSGDGAMNSLSDLQNTQGVYINATGTALLVPGGEEPLDSNNDIMLYPGWNMVGFPSTQSSMLASTALSGVSFSVVERYDPSSGSMVALDPLTDSMVRGQGYWLYLDSPTAQLWDVP